MSHDNARCARSGAFQPSCSVVGRWRELVSAARKAGRVLAACKVRKTCSAELVAQTGLGGWARGRPFRFFVWRKCCRCDQSAGTLTGGPRHANESHAVRDSRHRASRFRVNPEADHAKDNETGRQTSRCSPGDGEICAGRRGGGVGRGAGADPWRRQRTVWTSLARRPGRAAANCPKSPSARPASRSPFWGWGAIIWAIAKRSRRRFGSSTRPSTAASRFTTTAGNTGTAGPRTGWAAGSRGGATRSF